MPTCLGIYVDKNVIKYAKVSKERDAYTLETSGVKFYDNAEDTINKIINETFSHKTPVSVNLSDEGYGQADVFSMLSKKDLEKTAETEFEMFCNENGKNKLSLEYRKMFIDNLKDKDKKTILYSFVDKASLTMRTQQLEKANLAAVVPMPIAITNLENFKQKNNCIIVNIEKNTTLTTIIEGEIVRIDVVKKGMQNILDEIVIHENSYEKAYEICKNSTISTLDRGMRRGTR